MRSRRFLRALPALLLPALLALGFFAPRLVRAAFNTGTGPYLGVDVSFVLPDGKILIGGGFTSFNGVPRPGIARLNPDGSLDFTFNPNLGANYGSTVKAFALQADGKIIAVGNFIYFLDPAGPIPPQQRVLAGVVRLNPDGTQDEAFNQRVFTNGGAIGADPPGAVGPYALPEPQVYAVALQPDNKIVLGGGFISFNGQEARGLVRLNPDGTTDTTFSSGFGPRQSVPYPGNLPASVRSLVLEPQPNGTVKIIAGGNFQFFDFYNRRGIVRLDSEGFVDPSFNPGLGATPGNVANPTPGDSGDGGTVFTMVRQPNGQLILGGTFTLFNGVPRLNVARINADGTLDLTWNIGPIASLGTDGRVAALALQPDGKVILGGDFTNARGVARRGVARLNAADGSLDSTFNVGAGATVSQLGSTVLSVTVQPDGLILIAGTFPTFNNVAANGLARLNSDGSVDLPSSNPGNPGNPGVPPPINNLTGRVDRSFASTPGTAGGFPNGVAVQPDGRVIIVGSFTSYNGSPVIRVARLTADGALDPTFQVGRGPNGFAFSVVVQPDGKILVGGSFTDYDGSARFGVARLNADGTVDSSFDTSRGPNGTVLAMALQSDGRVVIGGFFTQFGSGAAANSVARLNSNGSFDGTFNPPGGADGAVRTLATQPDGKVYVGGDFRTFGGFTANRFLRLNANGTVDTSYFGSAGANGNVYSIAIQLDGKALIAGDFTSVLGQTRNRVARLNLDGSLDTTFNPGSGADKAVRAIVATRDGKSVVTGDFTMFGGSDRVVVRLNADGSIDGDFRGLVAAEDTAANKALAVAPDGSIYKAGNAVTSVIVPAPTVEDPSATITLTYTGIVRLVNPLAQGRLVNLSTRARVETGDNVVIGGFVVEGTAPKNVLVRALGPSLAAAGVPGVLADPSVQIIDSQGQTVDFNDNWQDRSANERTVFSQFGYTPGNNKEAALLVNLSPGAYTAVVRGVGGTTGVALVEAYDFAPDGRPRMINLSTRAKIGTGDNVVIGGFVVKDGASRVLVRGLGPSLASAVPGTVGSTNLVIMDSLGRPVATSSDWAANSMQAEAIRATGRAPTNAQESAIVAELPAGSYTAILRGGNGSTGIGLVEVYELR